MLPVVVGIPSRRGDSVANSWQIVTENAMEASLRDIDPEHCVVKVLAAVPSFKEYWILEA